MIWHPWADWVGTEPVTGPPIRWASIDTIAIHYTAAANLIDGDPGELWSGIPGYLRSIHHEYLTNRPQPQNGSTGYSIGYNVAVDMLGDAWELRGWNIKCAANLGHNDHTWAILVLVDWQDPASPAAVKTIRELAAMADMRALRPLTVKGHRDLAATRCPGDGIYAQIQAGAFDIHTAPKPPDPPTPTPAQEDEVIKLIVSVEGDPLRTGAIVAIDGAGTEMIGFSTPEDRIALIGALGVTPIKVSAAQYDDFVAHALAKT